MRIQVTPPVVGIGLQGKLGDTLHGIQMNQIIWGATSGTFAQTSFKSMMQFIPYFFTVIFFGCGVSEQNLKLHPQIELALRKELDKPTGNITAEDFILVENLDLYSKSITDIDLDNIQKMENLTALNLWGTQITDNGIKKIIGLKKMNSLNISDTQIGDESITEFVKLPQLIDVKLFGTKITDKGVGSLSNCKNSAAERPTLSP